MSRLIASRNRSPTFPSQAKKADGRYTAFDRQEW